MQLFANNALSTLAAALTNVGVTVSVQPGHGARFPTPAGGDYFLLTIFEIVNNLEANHEIVKVTARSVDTLTIVRAQEGTTARAFGVGAQASHRSTAGTLSHLAQTDMPTTFSQPVTILTAAAGTNTTQAASTAFVTSAISVAVAALVASSPAALDTLVELANALGNDANFATTVSTSLGNRLRVDAAQGLSAGQKAQAVANMGLAAVAVSGAKADVGLGNVDNTTDAAKPVSAAQAAAIALKAPLNLPGFTGSATFTDGNLLLSSTSANAAARNFSFGQSAFFGQIDLMISAAINGNAVVGTSIAAFSAAGLAVPAITATQANNAHAARFAGATGKLRVMGYSTSVTGPDIQSVNAAEDTFIPMRLIGSAITLAQAGNTNALSVSSAGVAVTGPLATTGSATIGDGTGLKQAYIAGTGFDLLLGASGGAQFGFASQAVSIVVNTTAVPMAIGTNAAQPLVFGTASFERARISATGNMLLGTTTDNGTDKLQIAGSITGRNNVSVTTNGAAGSNSSPLYTQLAFRGYQNNRLASIRSFDQTGTYASGGGIEFLVNANLGADALTSAMLIGANGRVMVGTTTDNGADLLQVAGNASFGTNVRVTNGAKVGNFGSDVNGPYLEAAGANAMRFFTGGVERMRVGASGAVLVGTAADNGVDALQVTGSTYVSTSIKAGGGFGCNGKAAQTAYASGGALAGVVAALVANGILSN